MTKCFLFVCLFLATCQNISAQPKDYKVVFDMTSADSINQKAVIRWVGEVIAASPDAKAEVVIFGQGTALALKDKSMMTDALTRLTTNKNVSFKICAIAMKNQHIDQTQLIPGVEITPDGIYEIMTRQREGWGYIKVSH
jgi:intracellular sulfur oxidation DsrE/DsrF family protein